MRWTKLVLPVLVLTGCAAQAGSGGGAQPTTDSPGPAADDALSITVDQGDGREPERYTLVCAGEQPSTHPDAQAACGHLGGLADPFAPIPADAVCTEIYGGPQTARITGTWRGQPVDLELSRANGCAIAQWDSLGPVLPGPVGVDPPG
jgi:hypothetical protein